MRKDPHIANIFSAEEEDCLSLEQMTAYQQGQLAGQDKHLVERHLLNCELCALTLESLAENGAEAIEAGAAEVADAAWDRVQQGQSRKRRGAFFWIASAASIALLVTVGYFTMRGPSDDDMTKAFTDAMNQTGPLDGTVGPDGNLAMDDPKEASKTAEFESAPEGVAAAEENLDALIKNASPHLPKSSPNKAVGPVTAKESPKPLTLSGKDAIKGGDYGGIDDNYFGNTGGGGVGRNVATSKDEISDQKYISTPTPMAKPTIAASPAMGTTANPARDNDFVSDEFAEYQTEGVIASEDVPKGRIEAEAKTMKKSEMVDMEASGKNVKTADKRPSRTMSPGKESASGGLATTGKADEANHDLKNAQLAKSKAEPTASRAANSDFDDASVASTPPSEVTENEKSFDKGLIAYKEGDYRGAAQEMRKATERTPSNLDAHIYAADAFLRISQPQAALYHIERVLAVTGNSHIDDAEWFKALAYLQLKDGKKAKAQLEKVAASNSKYKTQAEKALADLK